jgi:hypothetical protein
MSLTLTAEKPKPKQLRPFALLVTIIELGLASWVLIALSRHWRTADGPLPLPFWGAMAALGFTASLVLTNVVGLIFLFKVTVEPLPDQVDMP